MQDDDVGQRLKTLRENKGLSQRSLARLAGVPSSSVSLIENGRTNPSVGSLRRLLSAVDVSLADFFSYDLPPDKNIFFKNAELKQIGKGGVSYQQVGADLRNKRLQILYEVYEPGSDSGRTTFSHDGEEGGIVIEGKLEVTVDNERRVLSEGDAYLFDSRRPHRFRNITKKRCVIVSACTPPTF